MAELRPKVAQVPGIRVYMVNQPPINLGGQQGARSLYQFTLQDTDTAELYHCAPIFEEKMRDIPGHRGRQQRPADQEPADTGRHGPRQDFGARPEREPGRDRPLQRVRHAAGLADLRAEQPVSGDPAGRAGISEGSGGAVDALRPVRDRAADSARHRCEGDDRRGPADGQPHGPAAVGDDLLQPEAGVRARRCGERDSIRRSRRPCRRRSSTMFQGTAQAFQDSLQRPRPDPRHGDRRHLHRPRHPVRELHASADDSFGPARRQDSARCSRC